MAHERLPRSSCSCITQLDCVVRVKLARSHFFNCYDPAETNPTEVTTIECGDEPGRLKAFPPMLASTFRCRDAKLAPEPTSGVEPLSGSPRFMHHASKIYKVPRSTNHIQCSS